MLIKMNMISKYKSIGPLFIILYPLADILYNTFSNKMHYSTFSIAYFTIYIIITLIQESYLFSKRILVFCLVTFEFFIFLYPKSGSTLIQFFLFILLMNIFSSKHYLSILDIYITEHKKMISFVIIAYIFFLMQSIFFFDGIKKGWNTFVLCGPYSLPHILAYEMLVILMLCLLNYKHTNNKIWLMLALYFELMIVLTCVRSAVLASAIIFITFTSWFKLKRKINFVIIGIFILSIFLYYGIFDQIIEKTTFAIQNGSITNGREWIVNSMLKTFRESTIHEQIFGSGYFNLIESNYHNLGTAIQGHNDFLTVLISFGLIGITLYIWNFLSFIKGKNFVLFFAFLFILAFYNGLFLYMPMVIGLGIAKLFFTINKNVKINKEHIPIITG